MQMPISHGRPLVLSQNTGEDLPLPRGGRPRPSELSPWSGWCTCNGWKAWMLTEAGVRDPNCKYLAGGRPRPDSLLPRVT